MNQLPYYNLMDSQSDMSQSYRKKVIYTGKSQQVSGSHSALPFRPGVLSSLLSYWTRTTCHVTYLSDRDASRPGPPTSSRH